MREGPGPTIAPLTSVAGHIPKGVKLIVLNSHDHLDQKKKILMTIIKKVDCSH